MRCSRRVLYDSVGAVRVYACRVYDVPVGFMITRVRPRPCVCVYFVLSFAFVVARLRRYRSVRNYGFGLEDKKNKDEDMSTFDEKKKNEKKHV